MFPSTLEGWPAFGKGDFLFIKHPCRVAVRAPDGRLLFDRTLQIPGASTCSTGSAAIDTDGAVAVTAGAGSVRLLWFRPPHPARSKRTHNSPHLR
jgi:hypothetical protein